MCAVRAFKLCPEPTEPALPLAVGASCLEGTKPASVFCFVLVFIPCNALLRDTTNTSVCFYLNVTWAVEPSYLVGAQLCLCLVCADASMQFCVCAAVATIEPGQGHIGLPRHPFAIMTKT